MNDLNQISDLLTTLSDPTRLRILCLLRRNDEVCVCHIHLALDLPQPTVSRHLARLRKEKLVAIRKAGHWIHYRIDLQNDPLAPALFSNICMALSQNEALDEDAKRLDQLRSELCRL